MSEIKELVEFDRIAAGMARIQEEGNFLPDVTTKEGYEASKRFVLDVTTPTRSALDKAHKTAKTYWLNGGRSIDAKKNELMDLLVEIQEPHQKAYKDFDQIEKDKKAKFESDLQERINIFHNFCVIAQGLDSSAITGLIQDCGEIDTQEGFYHRGAEACKARGDALVFLNEALMSAVNYEAERQQQAQLAEQNRLQQIEIDKQQGLMRLQQEAINKKQEEFDRIENEEKERRQKEVDEQQRLIDVAALAEREKQAAIEREQYANEQAVIAADNAKKMEVERQQEQIRSDRIAAEKRESNKAHQMKIHHAITKVLVENGISDEDALKVITLAWKKQLPNLVINY